jgi:hypothetical protein
MPTPLQQVKSDLSRQGHIWGSRQQSFPDRSMRTKLQMHRVHGYDSQTLLWAVGS